MRETVKGRKALAERLGVSVGTISIWNKRGVLEEATLCRYGRLLIYDIEKVYQCLNYKRPTTGRGRPAKTYNR